MQSLKHAEHGTSLDKFRFDTAENEIQPRTSSPKILQNFAKLVWCALGSATGGKHVSAISHSRVHPVNSFKCSNRD